MSEKAKKEKHLLDIPIDVYKRFLQDIEFKDIPRDAVDLQGFCDKGDGLTYGEVGGPLRRSIQWRWANLKRKTHQNYKKSLLAVGVFPSRTTERLAEEERLASLSSKKLQTTPTVSSTAAQQPTQDTVVDDLSAKIASLSIKEPESVKVLESSVAADNRSYSSGESSSSSSCSDAELASLPPSPRLTQAAVAPPPPTITRRLMFSPASTRSTRTLGSPPPIMGVLASVSTNQQTPSMLASASPAPPAPQPQIFIPQDFRQRFAQLCDIYGAKILYKYTSPRPTGTKFDPYVVFVNTDAPEQNQEYEVQYVPEFSHNDYTRNGFHIRFCTHPQDFSAFSAMFPHDQYHDLLDRAILVSGPSQEFMFKDSDLYHAHRSMDCAKTQQLHNDTEDQIATDVNRQHSYWLLIFPLGIQLDWFTFSPDGTELERQINPLQFTNDMVHRSGARNDSGKDIVEMGVYWRVAIAGSHRNRVRNGAASLAGLFD